MNLLGYLIFGLEVAALAALSQLWLAVRVQRFLGIFAAEDRRVGVEPGRENAGHEPEIEPRLAA